MLCFQCDEQARGVCIFCGRAVCKTHMQNLPAIVTIFVAEGNTPKAVVVADALFCGLCKPQPEPVALPELL
jgi:hypothetical protein